MFYDRFIELCELKGVKPSAAAVAAGISKGTISVWKKKRLSSENVDPDQRIIEKLCAYFGVTETQLRGLNTHTSVKSPATAFPHDTDFIQWLQIKMIEHNLTVYQISKISGVHQSTIANWIAGAKPQEKKKSVVIRAVRNHISKNTAFLAPPAFSKDTETKYTGMATKIRGICKKNGTSIAALERQLGFGNGVISRWDKSTPSYDRLSAVANALGVSVSDLTSSPAPAKKPAAYDGDGLTEVQKEAINRLLTLDEKALRKCMKLLDLMDEE